MAVTAKRILIIEDDEDIRSTLQEFLETEGFAVSTAENGLVALELMKETGLPDLILLDMRMPVMSGWQFVEEFRRSYERTPPIVVMTAAANAEERARAVDASGWIEKPFGLQEILARVRAFLTS